MHGFYAAPMDGDTHSKCGTALQLPALDLAWGCHLAEVPWGVYGVQVENSDRSEPLHLHLEMWHIPYTLVLVL